MNTNESPQSEQEWTWDNYLDKGLELGFLIIVSPLLLIVAPFVLTALALGWIAKKLGMSKPDYYQY